MNSYSSNCNTPDCHSWWISKMQSGREDSLEEWYAIEFCFKLGKNATDPIWRVLALSNGISCWTPLKPQHSNFNPLAYQLWGIDFLTPPTPLIIPHSLAWISYATQKLMLDSCKMIQKQSEAFHTFLWHHFFQV